MYNKILIVDDDNSSQLLLKSILNILSYSDILMSDNGMDALKIIEENKDIDLIFMDMKMPNMSGYDTIKKIREFNKNVRIIVQSSFTSEEIKLLSLRVGANDYITKPLSVKEVNRVLK